MPIYNTEFGIQTNPPDPFQGGSLSLQARILNESEEFSYRYSRLKSYSQYLLYDQPPVLNVPSFQRWRGFQSGLRFLDGRAKPALDAYRLPIVVRKRGRGLKIWGRVRPGSGARYAQLQRKRGGSFVDDGEPLATTSAGYFTVSRSRSGSFRFEGYVSDGAGGRTLVGTSRVAKPIG
jgi:hypothetical protein